MRSPMNSVAVGMGCSSRREGKGEAPMGDCRVYAGTPAGTEILYPCREAIHQVPSYCSDSVVVVTQIHGSERNQNSHGMRAHT